MPAAPILPFIHSGAVLATNWREPGLVHVERHVHDAAVNAFDGAGKPYKGPSYKGGIAMVIVVIIGVALSWLIISAAFDSVADTNPPPGTVTVEDPP